MIDTTTALAYYAANGAALFPIPAGSKAPTGIVASFKHDHSSDPAVWQAWSAANPGCNFGVVAFASQWIIVDIDTTGPDGRDEAWALWCGLCADWGLPGPLAPHIQSPSGGWHVYCAVPPHIDASTLRQPDAIKKRINVRCIGYTVAAGSHYQDVPYLLMSNAPPHSCPDALLAHCTRATTRPAGTTLPGSRDKGDVAGLVAWLTERDAFSSYEDWCAIGMALRLEYGDDGFDLWELCHDATVTPDVAASKWESFATEPTADSVTLNSFLARAHGLGWRGTVRKSTQSMFSEVAALAAASGASLHSGMPLPPGPGGMPMLAGQAELARIAAPILAEFLAATADAPAHPISDDFPTLPAAMVDHELYAPMQACISRIVTMSEPPQKFKPSRVTDALAVLSVLHADVFELLCRRLRALGHTLPDRRIKLAAANISESVERVTVTLDKWEYDAKGEIQSDNSDNVQVLLGVLGLSLRWNAWLERMEIQGGTDTDLRWPEWTAIDDAIVAKLRTRANRTKTRFRPAKEFFWDSIITLAHANPVDPVLDTLSALQQAWDGIPRLSTWLTRYCGTPCDPYYQAVSRNIIGGMVARARTPGIKFDTMAVFFGRQGTGKSSLAAILAMRDEWFADSVLLGDASKELVLSLAGKLVVEIGEMGMRGNTDANHVKAMISRQKDEGRTAYARSVSTRHRRNIFCGTTNDDEPLQDPTGNRRFLPVPIHREIDLAGLRADIGQLVGEAAAQEAAGRSFDIPRDVWGLAATYQEAARAMSPAEELCAEWFADRDGAFYITATDVGRAFRMAGQPARYASFLKKMGWRNENLTIPGTGRKNRVWVLGGSGGLVDCVCLEPVQTATNGRVRMHQSIANR